MNNLTPEQLAFRAGYEQGRFDAQVEAAQQERNFCQRCGKRLGTNDWDVHTCTPPANANAGKPWVGLTDEEIMDLWPCETRIEFARTIEAKLKEKNT